MARGWESKNVESQVESADAERAAQRRNALRPADLELRHKREHLELSRRRVLLDIEAAKHPRHRAQLERALAFLEAELSKLDSPSKRPLSH
jgi:hypothetical protein